MVIHQIHIRKCLISFHGPFRYWSEFVFRPSPSTWPKRAPPRYSKVRATAEGKGWHCRWGLRNTGLGSRLPSLQLLLSMLSRKGWRKFGQKSFPISSIDWTLIIPSLYPPPPSVPPAHHPLTVIIPICYLYFTCYIYAVFSGPRWPTFYHYES